MSDKYDDIIDLPRPESKYPRMPRANRAAQFSPFAALTGHEEAIRETNVLIEKQSREADSGENEIAFRLLERDLL